MGLVTKVEKKDYEDLCGRHMSRQRSDFQTNSLFRLKCFELFGVFRTNQTEMWPVLCLRIINNGYYRCGEFDFSPHYRSREKWQISFNLDSLTDGKFCILSLSFVLILILQ